MKKHFIIFQRDFQNTSSTIGLVKFHRLDVENRFNTYQEAENFMIDKNNLKYFDINTEYLILPVYEKN